MLQQGAGGDELAGRLPRRAGARARGRLPLVRARAAARARCSRWSPRWPRSRWSGGSRSRRSRTSSRPPTSCCSPATRSAPCRASRSARSPRSCRTSSSARGPWTAWQMVGWGGVGVGGGAAATARPAGASWAGSRWRSPAASPGSRSAPWMDLYQWTLAARQDLDAYLAVSASSLPYNLAHAIGNVVFCLLIGPLFVRALQRYRRRFEVTWEAPRPAAGVAVALVARAGRGVGGRPVRRRHARPPRPPRASARPATCVGAQNRDGGFGGARGQSSSDLYTGWAALGLASARPQPARRAPPRRHARSRFLTRRARSVARHRRAGAHGPGARGARACRHASFAGRDLIAAIQARRRGDGSSRATSSYTAFGVLALQAAGRARAGRVRIAYLQAAARTATAASASRRTPPATPTRPAPCSRRWGGRRGRGEPDAGRRSPTCAATRTPTAASGSSRAARSNAQSTA